MVSFESYTLANGLKVILHLDTTTPIAAVNLLYQVGARNENPNRTGFAHLFEHLMFGGSKNIASYDKVLQAVGGENNAFTSNDVTNYYISLPIQNLETALWLESDRMNELAFSENTLHTQRNVVIEEFKQSYLNQPYGDLMLLLKPLAYKVHPYQWNTIGKDIKHIEEANLDEVKDFFYKFYRPNKAILSIAGNLQLEKTKMWVEKWFGSIPSGTYDTPTLPQEPPQHERRFLEVKRKVPYNYLVMAFHNCKRKDKDFYTNDLLSDILSNGESSRLQENLVNKKRIFSSISAYVTENFDNGLFIIGGVPSANITLQDAEEAIWEELNDLKTNLISDKELEKVKNKAQTVLYFKELSVQEKALSLCMFEAIDHAERIYDEEQHYKNVTADDMLRISQHIFRPTNASVLYYQAI